MYKPMDYEHPPTDFCLTLYRKQRDGGYPKRWGKGAIQQKMLTWAGYRCECCGASGVDVSLHVHSIRWNDKHDCRWENLLVCCVSCHTRIHNHKWQPGQPWTLSTTPEWMTARGYSNPVEGEVKVERNHTGLYLLLLLLGAIDLRSLCMHQSESWGAVPDSLFVRSSTP